jgi:hypothetical protein
MIDSIDIDHLDASGDQSVKTPIEFPAMADQFSMKSLISSLGRWWSETVQARSTSA